VLDIQEAVDHRPAASRATGSTTDDVRSAFGE
jgi:hypothetical protein